VTATTTKSRSAVVDVAFVQQRLALVGKVMLIFTAVLCLLQGALNPPERMHSPDFVLMVIGGGVWATLWLLLRRGSYGVGALRAIEAACLLGWAFSFALIGRFTLVEMAPALADLNAGNQAGHAALVAATGSTVRATLLLAMSYAFILRAALVPTTPRATVLLTGAAAVPLIVVWSVELDVWRILVDGESDAAAARRPHILAIWWSFTTLICYVISRVVYGLHSKVHAAQKLGQYTLVHKIGEGGMGVVYRAEHAMMQRPTAIKLLSNDRASATQLARFEREVQLTTRLTHPNTITIFDYGRTDGGVFYYVMELLDGASLQAVVERDRLQPAERVANVMLQIAGALEEAHGIGLIHRDIKPANIFLCHQGGRADVAKLLDFGLVKQVSDDDDAELTTENTITGTPLYLAPEAITSAEAADGRSDIYALGAVGYFMLVGEHVFESDSIVELCAHHLHTEPTPPSERVDGEIPEALEALILDCLSKTPARRPQSAADVGNRLAACSVADRWDADRARSWWEEHGDALRGPLEARDTSAKTVAIDLARLPRG